MTITAFLRILTVVVITGAASIASGEDVVVDADAFPSGAILTNAFPGVTLTAHGDQVVSPDVYALTNSYCSTGPNVFSYDGATPPSWGDGIFEWMRADFAGGATKVSIDFIADDTFDRNAVLNAFDSSGVLIDQKVDPGPLSAGQITTLTVAAPYIAYVTAEGDPIMKVDSWSLDRLVYTPYGLVPDNWGFETGDFARWAAVPLQNADVVDQHTDDDGDIYMATEGTYFACIKTDGPGNPTVVSRTFTAVAGANLEFDWFFDARDYGSFDDYLRYRVEDDQGTTVHSEILASISNGGIAVGDYGETGWNREAYTFGEDGEYTFYFEIANDGDSLFDSYAGIDNVVIPEPATFSVLVLGGGLAMIRRRRRAC